MPWREVIAIVTRFPPQKVLHNHSVISVLRFEQPKFVANLIAKLGVRWGKAYERSDAPPLPCHFSSVKK